MSRWWWEVRWFLQRGRRGWADCDVWSFDHYLSRVIAEGLAHLAEHSMGYPHGSTPESWTARLRELSTALQAYHDGLFEHADPGWYPAQMAKLRPLLDDDVWGNLWR